MFNNCRNAFTLAETLITLVIIGVIAALTIPNLISSYNAVKGRSLFLKAGSIVQNAGKQMAADKIFLIEADPEEVKSYFKVRNGDTLPTVNPYRNYYNTMPASNASLHPLSSPFNLDNGMTVWISKITVGYKFGCLVVDLNGVKNKPNIYGKDVFFWYQDPQSGAVIPYGSPAIKNSTPSYYTSCPGVESAEAGIGCAFTALTNLNWFKDIKIKI